MQGLRGVIGMKVLFISRSPTSSPLTQKARPEVQTLHAAPFPRRSKRGLQRPLALVGRPLESFLFSKKRLSRAPKTQPRGRGQGNHFRTNRLRGQRAGFGTHSPPDFRSLLQSRDFLLRFWDPQKTQPNALLVEITNTPWGERYAKAFRWADSDTNGSTKSKHRFEKEFHVSPFIGMNVSYDWRFSLPAMI